MVAIFLCEILRVEVRAKVLSHIPGYDTPAYILESIVTPGLPERLQTIDFTAVI